MSFDSADTRFLVLVNAELQYSLWPDYKPVPLGWTDSGFAGDRASCLAHISEVWTDMRPLSLREAVGA